MPLEVEESDSDIDQHEVVEQKESSWSSWCCWIAVIACLAVVIGARIQADNYDPILADQYEVLGLSSTATIEEVRRRYRKLVLSLHPDKCIDDDCQEKFMNVKNAYLAITRRDDTMDDLVREYYGPLAGHILRKKKQKEAKQEQRAKL